MSTSTSSVASDDGTSPLPSNKSNCSGSVTTIATEPSDKMAENDKEAAQLPVFVRGVDVTPIFSENVLAKILQVAERGMDYPVGLNSILNMRSSTPDKSTGQSPCISRVCPRQFHSERSL